MLASFDRFCPRFSHPLPVALNDENEHGEDECFNYFINDIIIL